jgi:hypothetical protein
MVAMLLATSVASAGFTWAVPHDELGYGAHIRLAATPQQVMVGGELVWEYVYDIGNSAWPSGEEGWRMPDAFYGAFVRLDTGDVGDLVNLRNGKVAETWSAWAAGNYVPGGWWGQGWSDGHVQWVDGADLDADTITDEWTYGLDSTFGNANYMTFDAGLATWAYNEGVDNTWHAPSDYDPVYGSNGEMESEGVLYDDTLFRPGAWGGSTLTEEEDGVYFETWYGLWADVALENNAQLAMTVRLLSKGAPTGTVTLIYDSGYGANKFAETVVGPGPIPEPATMSLLALGGIAALIRRKK